MSEKKKNVVTKFIDRNSRISLPKEFLTALNWIYSDDANRPKVSEPNKVELSLEIDGDTMVLRRVKPACAFCGKDDDADLNFYRNKYICDYCLEDINNKKVLTDK